MAAPVPCGWLASGAGISAPRVPPKLWFGSSKHIGDVAFYGCCLKWPRGDKPAVARRPSQPGMAGPCKCCGQMGWCSSPLHWCLRCWNYPGKRPVLRERSQPGELSCAWSHGSSSASPKEFRLCMQSHKRAAALNFLWCKRYLLVLLTCK